MGVETQGNPIWMTTLRKMEEFINWGRKNAIWPLQFGLACCAIEMMAMAAARFDVGRFGAELLRASPRQSDLMIVSGRPCQKMAPVIRHLYDQMLEPKYVIAMGDCASCGGIFNNYAHLQGVDKILPVDVYVPGCPPTPEALIRGIMMLQEKIGRERPLNPEELNPMESIERQLQELKSA